MSAIIDGSNGVTAANLVVTGANAPANGIYLPTTNAVAIATNSTNAVYIDANQNLQFNSGYGSVSTAYGCRAWVSFDGTTSSPSTRRGSGNVSSVTKNGTGDYTINFASALTDINYAAVATVGDSSNTTLNNRSATANPVSSSAVRVETFVCTVNNLIDNSAISVLVFR
jgi:hypothetical protein